MADRQEAASASADEVVDAQVIDAEKQSGAPETHNSIPASSAAAEDVTDAEILDAVVVDAAPGKPGAADAAHMRSEVAASDASNASGSAVTSGAPSDSEGEILDAELVEEDESSAADGDVAAADDDAANTGDNAAGEDGDSDSDAQASGKKRRSVRDAQGKQGKRPRRILLICVAVLLAVALVLAGLFCWQKWLRFDDAADIQGSWQVQEGGESIVFDGRDMKITKAISYEYRLDTEAKTISYQFGELSGAGHYYFSADRQTLVILENGEQAGLLAEAGFLPQELLDRAGEDGVIVLTKLSDNADVEPSSNATGISDATTGEREYVGQQVPESSSSSASSSSSGSHKGSSSSSSSSSSDTDDSNRGFVDSDGDGYDDESGLDYEDFMAQRESGDEDSDDYADSAEDGYDEGA